jgi:hypothetical protein
MKSEEPNKKDATIRGLLGYLRDGEEPTEK